jgi:hypothetical protein
MNQQRASLLTVFPTKKAYISRKWFFGSMFFPVYFFCNISLDLISALNFGIFDMHIEKFVLGRDFLYFFDMKI